MLLGLALLGFSYVFLLIHVLSFGLAELVGVAGLAVLPHGWLAGLLVGSLGGEGGWLVARLVDWLVGWRAIGPTSSKSISIDL